MIASERRLKRDDRAVPPYTQPGDVALIAIRCADQEVLGPRLHPLHGMPEPARDGRNQNVFRIDVTLAAEAAPDIGRDHADGFLAQPQRAGDRPAHGVRDLRGRPDREAAIGRFGDGKDTPRLDRQRSDPGHVELQLHRGVGLREAALDVPNGTLGESGNVVRPLGEHARSAVCARSVDRRGHGQRLVVDDDGGRAIGCVRGFVGDDDSDGFSEGAHDGECERGMAILADGRRRRQRWHSRARTFGQVGAAEYGDHTR